MKKCSKCGKVVSDEVLVCDDCGNQEFVYENEQENLSDANDIESVQPKTKLQIFMHNLGQLLEQTKTLVVLCVALVVCVLGFVYFFNQVQTFKEVEEAVGSIFFIDIVFLIFSLLLLGLVIASVVLKIKKIKRKK